MKKGFTLLEMMITISILIVLFGLSAFIVSRVQENIAVGSADTSIINIVTAASRRARIGEQGSAWGIHFPYDEVTRAASEVVIFSGASYLTRNPDLDISYPFPSHVHFQNVSLSGAAPSDGNDHEVIFDSISGDTDQYGSITLESFGRVRTLFISSEGLITKEY